MIDHNIELERNIKQEDTIRVLSSSNLIIYLQLHLTNSKMPSHTNNKKKKTKSKDKKKSSKSEYYQKTLDIPASPDEFMKATAEHLFKMSQLPAQLLQGPGGEEAFEQYMREVVKPMDVTPEVIEEIRRTKISDSIMWYVDTKNDVDDNLVLMCNVHLLDNSTFSDSDDSPNDYSIESNKNRIVCQIACCAKECGKFKFF